MHWLILGLIAVALLLLSSQYPRLAYSILATLLVAGVLLYRFSDRLMLDTGEDIPLSDLQLSHVTMLPAYAGSFQFNGRLQNQSKDRSLAEVEIEVTMLDCPAGSSAQSDCITIGEKGIRIVVTVPPGQARDFHENIFLGNTQASGELRWRHQILASRAR